LNKRQLAEGHVILTMSILKGEEYGTDEICLLWKGGNLGLGLNSDRN
jgi:hypothetical protein